MSAFRTSTSGNALILFALTLPVVIGLVGSAVEFSRGADFQSKLQYAMDSAVLRAADAVSRGEDSPKAVQEIGEQIFFANLQGSLNDMATKPLPTFVINEKDGRIEGDVDAKFKNAFLSLNEGNLTEVGVKSQAGFSIIDVELSLMLDVTGSMRGQKLRDLQSASRSLVDSFLKDPGALVEDKVRIALVPYSASVNAGNFFKSMTRDAEQTKGNCIVERGGIDRFTDASPATSAVPPIPDNDDIISYTACPSAALQPLTNNRGKLLNTINSFNAGGCTAGHIGIANTYYTLSPKWDVWGAGAKPKPYKTDNLMKVALLMTDGSFNTHFGVDGWPLCNGAAKAKSDMTARELCRNMREDGILVYSVAFKAPSDAEDLLRDCANEKARYFETSTGGELIAAFEAIASDIRQLRLTQ
ncbi:MAG: pilus assembly protein [Pseudomonadota bacterium]